MIFSAADTVVDRQALRSYTYAQLCDVIGMRHTQLILSAPVANVRRRDGSTEQSYGVL